MSKKEIIVKDKLVEEDRLQKSVVRVANKFKGDCTEFTEVGNMPREFDSKKYDKIESDFTISDNDMVKLLDEI